MAESPAAPPGTGTAGTAGGRAVHLGLGAFARAHQLWYTAHAGGGWRYTGFTGRTPDVARTLTAQECRYTVLVRGPDGDRAEILEVLADAFPAGDTAALRHALADPAVALATLTVTEAGYHQGPDGRLARDAAVGADLAALRDGAGRAPSRTGPTPPALATVPLRLAVALAARRAAGAGPIALVSCDNLSGNGASLSRVVADATRAAEDAGAVEAGLADWVADTVSFPSTMVDRIVPATSPADVARAAELTGWADPATVVAEPFSEWVLAGAFPAGRPAWEDAGAEVVPDVTPFEQRKLWLLNGAHSLLAYTAPPRGHETIADAIADPECRAEVEALWDCVTPLLDFDAATLDTYRAALLDRFANPAIRHRLAQVAGSGSQKLAVRVVPLVRRFREAGQDVPAPLTDLLGAWVAHLRGAGAPVDDPRADELVPAAQGPLGDAVPAVLGLLDPALPDDRELVRATADAVGRLPRRPAG